MTLKLEVGKTYVDSYEDKVTVASIINGYCLCEDDRGFYWFTTDGKALAPANERPETSDINSDDGCHLVAEHKEPVVHEKYLTWYKKDGKVEVIVCDEIWEDEKIKFTGGELLKREKITYEEK
jgi:hypothetical protein